MNHRIARVSEIQNTDMKALRTNPVYWHATAARAVQTHRSGTTRSGCRRAALLVRCNQSGGGQRPLVVVGSINADLVLQVSRLPDAGETMEAGSLNYYPGGKARHPLLRSAKHRSSVCTTNAQTTTWKVSDL